MSLRNALTNARLVTLGVLFAGLWTIFVAVDVIQMTALWGPGEVGTSAAGGVAGVLVMGGFLVLLVFLFGALGQSEPAPSTWPPER